MLRAPSLFTSLLLGGAFIQFAGCASPGDANTTVISDGAPGDGARADLARPIDLASHDAADAAIDMTPGCPPLGGPDHCGTCGTVCPGHDDKGTRRTCSSTGLDATCDIQCKGEYYDLNGSIDDGCEALDLPNQDGPMNAVAITLPDVTQDPMQKSNPDNVLGFIYGDQRLHDMAPAMRPLGRDDWYAVTAVGMGTPNVTMKACLGIVDFPQDNVFEVCISDIGSTSFKPMSCRTAGGGGPSVCVQPPAQTDAGGPYLVRVRKMTGTNTKLGYALFLQH